MSIVLILNDSPSHSLWRCWFKSFLLAVLVQPSRASVERVFWQVALMVATTADKRLDDMLEFYLLNKINNNIFKWVINTVKYFLLRYLTLQTH